MELTFPMVMKPILNPYGAGIPNRVYPGGIPSSNLYGSDNAYGSYPGAVGKGEADLNLMENSCGLPQGANYYNSGRKQCVRGGRKDGGRGGSGYH